jgi:hypothetical protein
LDPETSSPIAAVHTKPWGEFFFFIIHFFDKNRNTGFSSKTSTPLKKVLYEQPL